MPLNVTENALHILSFDLIIQKDRKIFFFLVDRKQLKQIKLARESGIFSEVRYLSYRPHSIDMQRRRSALLDHLGNQDWSLQPKPKLIFRLICSVTDTPMQVGSHE